MKIRLYIQETTYAFTTLHNKIFLAPLSFKSATFYKVLLSNECKNPASSVSGWCAGTSCLPLQSFMDTNSNLK